MIDTERTLLLFDIDEVLINPIGYNVAMRLAVEYFVKQMGLDFGGPTDQEIAAFHAYGMTNEWLSGAMCLAAILVEAADVQPDRIRGSLQSTMVAFRQGGRGCSRPDFAAVAEAVYQNNASVVHTATPVFDTLSQQTSPKLYPVLSEVLGNIRPPDAPFAAIFQQFALGSAQFSDIYDLEPILDCDPCLALDESALSSEVRERLRQVLASGDYFAAIYSARPSLPPKNLSVQELEAVDRRIYPPEAEMAAAIAGLSDLPLIGAGSMAWLAECRGKALDSYVKPSPAQALAAIAAAISGDERTALEAAAHLVEENHIVEPLEELAEGSTHVVVFEDSSGGIRAARQAADVLRTAGTSIRVTGIGIAQDHVKREILAETADWLAPNINVGLSSILDNLTPP